MRPNTLPYRSPGYAALLGAIIVAYLVIGALYATQTPPWQSPDEPAHYNYIAQVASRGCCPVIEQGDWDAARLEEVKREQFPEGVDLSWVEYEDHQPPLYYLIGSVLYRQTDGSLIALRLLSVILGAGTVLAAYVIVARLFPPQPVLALAAAMFVAFVPEHIAILASVNNDSLAGLLLGVLMAIAVGYLGNPVVPDYDGKPLPFDESHRPHPAALGGFLGLIFLTKLTVYLPGLAIVLLAIAWRWRIEGRPAKWLIQQIFWVALLALLVGGWWWLRNASIYGFPDVMAQAAHNRVVAGQPLTADKLAEIGTVSYLREALRTTYRSFWGQFGWMGVPMQDRDYWAIGAFLVWVLAGVGILIGRRGELDIAPQRRAALWTLAWSALATAAEVVYYNFTFVQFQGRYFYPALIPLALLAALGGWGWSLIVQRWVGSRLAAWVPALAVAWMPIFTLYALFRYVIPFLD